MISPILLSKFLLDIPIWWLIFIDNLLDVELLEKYTSGWVYYSVSKKVLLRKDVEFGFTLPKTQLLDWVEQRKPTEQAPTFISFCSWLWTQYDQPLHTSANMLSLPWWTTHSTVVWNELSSITCLCQGLCHGLRKAAYHNINSWSSQSNLLS